MEQETSIIKQMLPLQNNKITEQKRCKQALTGTIYVIIGSGKLHSYPYVRYVGQTVQELEKYLRHYINLAKGYKGIRPLLIWINEQIQIDERIKIIPIAEMYKRDLGDCETAYISYYKSIYPDLLNVSRGGESGGGWRHNENTRKIIAEKARGKHQTIESILRLCLINLGNKYSVGKKASKETLEKLSRIMSGSGNPNYGKKHSLEERRKNSERQKIAQNRPEVKEKKSMAMMGNKCALGYKHTEEWKKSVSGEHNSQYGKTPWNKGLTKEIDSRVAKYASHHNNTFKKGHTPWNRGMSINIVEIRNKHENGYSSRILAKEYGVSYSYIRKIVTNKINVK